MHFILLSSLRDTDKEHSIYFYLLPSPMAYMLKWKMLKQNLDLPVAVRAVLLVCGAVSEICTTVSVSYWPEEQVQPSYWPVRILGLDKVRLENSCRHSFWTKKFLHRICYILQDIHKMKTVTLSQIAVTLWHNPIPVHIAL